MAHSPADRNAQPSSAGAGYVPALYTLSASVTVSMRPVHALWAQRDPFAAVVLQPNRTVTDAQGLGILCPHRKPHPTGNQGCVREAPARPAAAHIRVLMVGFRLGMVRLPEAEGMARGDGRRHLGSAARRVGGVRRASRRSTRPCGLGDGCAPARPGVAAPAPAVRPVGSGCA